MNKNRTKYTLEQKEQMVKLRIMGFTFVNIAKTLNINNLTTIRNVCTEAGLAKKSRPQYSKFESGQRVNNFILIEKSIKKLKNNTASSWKCLCDCGNFFTSLSKHLRRRRKSCGCMSKSNRFKLLPSKTVIGNIRLNHYKSAAKRRNIAWNLSDNKFLKLLFSNCYYCKSPPMNLVKTKKHSVYVNGVDRVDSNKSYEANNCVACCKFCNRAKGDASLEVFKNWINCIRLNFNEKNMCNK